MTQILLATALFALVFYGLQRNHVRTAHLYDRLYGGVDFEDRDAVRLRADVRAVRDHEDRRPSVPTPRHSADQPYANHR